MLEGGGMSEPGWQDADGGSSSSDREGLGRSAPLRNLEAFGERPDALACCAVRDRMGINPATLSHHMKELEIVGLVEVVREGKFASYVLRRDVLEAFFQRLKGDLA
jgi:ArsR family transcriptional regulator, arsenate/arsenite/antimonite-responsive transcriptional repressor